MLFSIKRFWNKAKSGDQIKNMQKKVSKLKCVLQNLLVKLKNKITQRSVVIYLLEFLTRSFFVYFLQVGKVKVCVIFFFAKKIFRKFAKSTVFKKFIRHRVYPPHHPRLLYGSVCSKLKLLIILRLRRHLFLTPTLTHRTRESKRL